MINRKRESGFTFVEVLIVLFVVAVLGGASVYIVTQQGKEEMSESEQDESVEDTSAYETQEYTVEVPSDWVVLADDNMPFTAYAPAAYNNGFGSSFDTNFNGIGSKGYGVSGDVNSDSMTFAIVTGYDSVEENVEESESSAKQFGIEYEVHDTHYEVINGEQWLRQDVNNSGFDSVHYLKQHTEGSILSVQFTGTFEEVFMRQVVASVEAS